MLNLSNNTIVVTLDFVIQRPSTHFIIMIIIIVIIIIESLILWTSFMITLALYSKQNLVSMEKTIKFCKIETHEQKCHFNLTSIDHKYNILFAGIHRYICYVTIVFRKFHK